MSQVRSAMRPRWTVAKAGGDGGIRTLDRALQPYNGLANRRLQPLGHISVRARYARRGGNPQAAIRPEGMLAANKKAQATGTRRGNLACRAGKRSQLRRNLHH